MNFIQALSTQLLTNGEHYDLMLTIKKWIEGNKLPSKLSALTKALLDFLSQEESALATSQKSPLSDQIHQADMERDIYLQSLRHRVQMAKHIPAEAEAAEIIRQLFTDYRTLKPSMNLNDETGLLANLIPDLEGKAADAVAALGMESIVQKLKAANNRVVELTEQRDVAKSHQVAGIMRNTRSQTDGAYFDLVRMVNALVVVEDPKPYLEFIDFMNTLITRTKRQSLKQKAKAPDKNGSGNNGSDNSGNGNDDDDVPQG